MNAFALVEAPDHVCCRYRIRAFEPAFRAQGGSLQIEALRRGPIARIQQFSRLGGFDAIIVQRRLLPGWQLSVLRRFSRRLIFDFDDAVYHRDSYHPRGIVSRSRARRFAQIVRAADVVIAGNDFLARGAIRAGAGATSVRMIPTCIDYLRYFRPEHEAIREGLELVWVGSSSTLQGLQRSKELWHRLAIAIPNLRLRQISDRFCELDPMTVIKVDWSEATEANEIMKGDIGVSWVPDDEWSRGKCGLKVLQYQASSIPVIANSVGVHSLMIEDGISGFLADSEQQWVEAVRALSDPARREAMGRAGRANVETHYSIPRWAPEFLRALAGC
jgi:glycosyltransferase involved in cell wall biosynthesis